MRYLMTLAALALFTPLSFSQEGFRVLGSDGKSGACADGSCNAHGEARAVVSQAKQAGGGCASGSCGASSHGMGGGGSQRGGFLSRSRTVHRERGVFGRMMNSRRGGGGCASCGK